MADEQEKKPFWNYESGATVEGNFLRFIHTTYGVAMELDNLLVDCNPSQIRMAVGTFATKIAKGDKVKVSWKGKSPEGQWHLYDVFLNGALIERPRGFQKASQNQVLDFFGLEEEENRSR